MNRYRFSLVFCVVLGTAFSVRAGLRAEVASAVVQAEAARVAVMRKVIPTVVAIFPPVGRGGGSGVVISPDGFALTNFHVAKPCGNSMKCGMADGKVYDAVIVGMDPPGDVALIKLLGRDDFPAAELGDSDLVRPGDACFAAGNPFLLANDFQPTVTFGIVSGTHRYQYPAGTLLEYADCIQTDASINPGNSGGPLFDMEGRVIGINGRGSFEKRGRVNVGVAYAISINQIKNFLGQLHAGRIVDHATLGATVAFDAEGRVIVDQILEESDAWRRGLRYGDEIVSFGGRPITTPNAFKNVLGIYPKGWRVPLSYRRERQRYDVLVRLAGVHGKEELLEKAEGGPRRVPMPIPQPEEKPKDGEKPASKRGHKPDIKSKPNDNTFQTARLTGRQLSGELAQLAEDGEQPNPEPIPAEKKPQGEEPPGSNKPDRAPKMPGGPGRPIPVERLLRPTAPMPDHVKKFYEAKHGFANYYFNKLHRGRVWEAWKNRGGPIGAEGNWVLLGELPTGGKFRLEITDTGCTLKLPKDELAWTAGENLTASLAPPRSGGMFLSFYLLRRFHLDGLEKHGDVYYLGTAPLPGRDGLVDVLVATHRNVECHYYFDPADGALLALEMFPEEHTDPCELYFAEYQQRQGRSLPAKIEVRTGDTVFTVLKIEQFTFEKPATN